MDSEQLLRAAQRAGLRAVGATVGRPGDRLTWSLTLHSPTRDAETASAAFLASYDPDDPGNVDADRDDAAEARITPDVRALFLAQFRMTEKRDPTAEESAAWRAAMLQACRDVRR